MHLDSVKLIESFYLNPFNTMGSFALPWPPWLIYGSRMTPGTLFSSKLRRPKCV